METKKILSDPDLHYGIAPEDPTGTIQKAPQRPRRGHHASEAGELVSEPTTIKSKALRSNFSMSDFDESDDMKAADIERLLNDPEDSGEDERPDGDHAFQGGTQ